MFGESMVSKKESSQEQGEQPKEWGARKKMEKMVKSFNFSEKAKKTIMAVLAASILLQAGTVMEKYHTSEDEKLQISMHGKIGEIKSTLTDSKNNFFEGISEKAGIDPEQLVEKFSLSNSMEVVGETPTYDEQSSSGAIDKEGENVYFASYAGLGVVSGGEFGFNSGAVDSWDEYSEEFKTYVVNGVEIEPASAAMTFTAEGVSENQAILEALEDAANMQEGVHVETKRSLENSEGEGKSEMFSEHIGTSHTSCIDSYKVTGIEKSPDGMYKASVEVVFGKIAGNVQRKGENSEWINPDTQKTMNAEKSDWIDPDTGRPFGQ